MNAPSAKLLHVWLALLFVTATLSAAERPTFSRDVAPILFEHCAPCHKPGPYAPFTLLSFADAGKRAKLIAEVTGRRYMPPWLPDQGTNHFADARVLPDRDMETIRRWAEAGAPEGNPSDLPKLTLNTNEWYLGAPDLIVEAPEAFLLPPDGKDIYQNFVIPSGISTQRLIRAVEILPGNRAAHHGFLKVDLTSGSRRLDAQYPGGGFPGMDYPSAAAVPDGHLLAWQPGRLPVVSPPGLPWRLQPKSDFLLQIHFQPTGRQEAIKPKLGLYFTDTPATNQLFKISMDNYAIDIPAGETNYVIEESWVVPQPFEMLALIPHAHRTGKTLEAFATLPDGRRQDLITIRNWDFNWQTDYRFAQPPRFAAGTRLTMRYRYDNSTNNAQNPHNPPQRIRYGPQTTDEMGSVTFQILTRNQDDLKKLTDAFVLRLRDDVINYAKWKLTQDPEDAHAHVLMAKVAMHSGDRPSAWSSVRRALKSDPKEPDALYLSGVLHRLENQPDLAIADFEEVLKAWPDHPKAHGNLGLVFFEMGKLSRAEYHFREAIKIDPDDTIARGTLEQIRAKRPRR